MSMEYIRNTSMITVTATKQERIMVRGGKREGAGRPAKQPTMTVRINARAAGAAKVIAEYFLGVADVAFREQYRSSIERNGYEPVVRLTGLEMVETRSLLGTRGAEVPVIVAIGEMGGIRSTFEVGLDGRGFYGRDEEEI